MKRGFIEWNAPTTEIRVITRVANILKAFSAEEPEIALGDITKKLGLPKATGHRILLNLTKHGILERLSENGRYRLGHLVYTLGNIYLLTTDILKAAGPVIGALNRMTSEDVNLGILEGNRVVVILREQSKHPFRVNFHVGKIFLAHASAMGKAMLSELSESEIYKLYPEEKIEKITDKTVATRTELKQQLEQIRARGYSHNKEEAFDGVEAFGSVVRDYSGKVIAGLSIGVPVSRSNKWLSRRLPKLVRMGASLVSYTLGYEGEENPVLTIEEIEHWWAADENNK